MTAQQPALLPDTWAEPELNEALVNKSVLVIKEGSEEPVKTQVFLMRGNPTTKGEPVRFPQAYQLVSSAPFYTGRWIGEQVVKELYKAYVLEFVERKPNGEPVFREPSEEDAQLVVIKRVRRFEPRGQENPYHEIAAMTFLQAHGDCAIECIDGLRDDSFIYIVTPFLPQSDLHYHIPWHGRGLPESEVRVFYRKLLQQVEQKHRLGVVHCDLKGENILLVLNSSISTNPTLKDLDPILTDFAQSRKVRVSLENGGTHLMTPAQAGGSDPFRAPEVHREEETNPYAIDVWSLAVILFNLLTGRRLYLEPFDALYQHFVTNQGVVDSDINREWLDAMTSPLVQAILDVSRLAPDDSPIARDFYWVPHINAMIPAVEDLSPEVRSLLKGMLEPNPEQRLTLKQVQEHPWMFSEK